MNSKFAYNIMLMIKFLYETILQSLDLTDQECVKKKKGGGGGSPVQKHITYFSEIYANVTEG